MLRRARQTLVSNLFATKTIATMLDTHSRGSCLCIGKVDSFFVREDCMQYSKESGFFYHVSVDDPMGSKGGTHKNAE